MIKLHKHYSKPKGVQTHKLLRFQHAWSHKLCMAQCKCASTKRRKGTVASGQLILKSEKDSIRWAQSCCSETKFAKPGQQQVPHNICITLTFSTPLNRCESHPWSNTKSAYSMWWKRFWKLCNNNKSTSRSWHHKPPMGNNRIFGWGHLPIRNTTDNLSCTISKFLHSLFRSYKFIQPPAWFGNCMQLQKFRSSKVRSQECKDHRIDP